MHRKRVWFIMSLDTHSPKKAKCWSHTAGHARGRSRWPLARPCPTGASHPSPSHGCEPMPCEGNCPKFSAALPGACCRPWTPFCTLLTLLASSSRPLEPAPLCCSPSASLCLLPQSAALPLCPSATLSLSAPLCPSLPLSATRSRSLRPCRSHLAHAVMGGAGISQRASLERAWK